MTRADRTMSELKRAIVAAENDSELFWIGAILRGVLEQETGIKITETRTKH